MAGASATLISVDWGTTSLRCTLVDGDGNVLEHRKSERGILKAGDSTFEAILREEIEPWLGQFAEDATVPVLLSGMIGSRQGWLEAAYLRCPASPRDLAQNLARIETPDTALARCDIRIVPGMDFIGRNGAPDVMRGEETQVLGGLIGAGLKSGIFVLPGTHSKWVIVRDETILEFRTYMTGEIYAALLDATILGRLARGDQHDEGGFQLGIETSIAADEAAAGPGDLMNLAFSARSRVLLGGLAESAVRSYLSGLLIGAELMSGIRAATVALGEDGDDAVVRILAEDPLLARYQRVATTAGLEVETSANNPVATAHMAIARLAGIVP